MQQPHRGVDSRPSYDVKREARNEQKWPPQPGMEGFSKQMIFPRSHPSHKLMQQQQLQQMQQFMHAQHAGMPGVPVPSSAHGGPYKAPVFNFTSHDLGVYLYGKQDLRMVRIEPRNSDANKQPKDKGKPAKWCDMCQEVRFGECHKHGPLTNIPSHSTVPLNAPMSYAISTFPDEVGLCISGLPFAGYGVFARQTIPTGTWIGPYEGTRIPFEEGVKKMNKDTPFLWEICANGRVSHFLDASDENTSSWMRFIQCARFKEEQNLYVFQYCATIYYRAFKDVPPGVELLVWYDEKYPHAFGLPLDISDMATCSVESIQTSSETKQPPVEGMLSSAPAMIPAGSGHPGDAQHIQAAEMMRRDLAFAAKASSSSASSGSTFSFPRPAPPGAPVHVASSGAFHAGPVPMHIRHRQEALHPGMQLYGGQQPPTSVPVTVPPGSSSHVLSGAPSGSKMPPDESRLPNAPVPVQLVDKDTAVLNSVEGPSLSQVGQGRLMPPGKAMGSSSSLAGDGLVEERKTPDKQPGYHSEFAPSSFGGPNTWQWACNNCNKSFSHKAMLHNHACVRSSPVGPYRRERSPLPFNDGGEGREHLEAPRDRPFKCRYCARTFAGAATLNNHMRTHFEQPRRIGNP